MRAGQLGAFPHIGSQGASLARSFPIYFFASYLGMSLVVFAFGPCQFEVANPFSLYLFALIAIGAIVLGFSFGASYHAPRYTSTISADAVLRGSILVTLCTVPLTFLSRNYAELSLAEALRDPGAAYSARLQELLSRDGISMVSIVRAFLGPAIGLFVPVGIVYWNRLVGVWRWLWLAGLVGLVIESFFVGAAKGLFDVVLIVPWFMWLYFYRRSQSGPRPSLIQRLKAASGRHRKTVFVGLVTVVIMSLGIKYFAHSRQSRYGMVGDEYPPYTTGWSQPLYGVYLPPSLEYPIHMLSRYWTHGYVGLAECLQLPFEWSFGVGHSTFLMRYAGRLANDPDFFLNRSYPIRLESATGYNASNYWHTIYPWLASDFTFPGAIVVIGIFAFLLSRAWHDCLTGMSPFAPGVLAQLLLMFYYIPANNARLMFSEEIITFWGLMFLWAVTRRTIWRGGSLHV